MYKKVVVLGGGTGISYLLKGLKDFPVDITAVITVSDNGRSTGKLRKEFNTPAVGDIRKVITSLSNIESYTFPTVDELSKASIEDLRALGLGFRDKYIYETTKKIKNGDVNLEETRNEKDTTKIRKKLLTLSGVGPKVADCILLFSTLKRFDVFPIDVWVRRVMNDLYIHNPDEAKVNKKEIEELAKEKFGNLEGIAQQYLFYWKRENT